MDSIADLLAWSENIAFPKSLDGTPRKVRFTPENLPAPAECLLQVGHGASTRGDAEPGTRTIWKTRARNGLCRGGRGAGASAVRRGLLSE